MELLEQIRAYRPWNEQEERDRALILQALSERPLVFTREDGLAHMTASAWVVTGRRDKVLMAYHKIYSLESLTVDGHEKRGVYVSSHLHLNVTYLIEADDAGPLAAKPDENKAVAWFGREEAVAASSEPWFRERIYQKLNDKLRALGY